MAFYRIDHGSIITHSLIALNRNYEFQDKNTISFLKMRAMRDDWPKGDNMEYVAKWIDNFFKIIGAAAGIVFISAILLDFANVVGRYIFHRPIFWAEEIVVFEIIWCVMAGAALVVWRSNHLRVEILEMFISKRSVIRLRLALLLMIALVGLVMVGYGTQFVWFILSMDQRSTAANIPMGIPFAAIPIGFGLIVLAAVARIARYLFGSSSALESTAQGDAADESEASL